MVERESNLKKLIAARNARIAIIGLGYVGLPLAVRLAERGFSVIGADKAKARINPLIEGKSTVEGLVDKRIRKVVHDGKLKPIHVFYMDGPQKDPEPDPDLIDQLFETDIFIICVQTPLRKSRGWEPDLQWVKSARRLIESVCQAEEQAGRLPAERLIILESTTYPGTTRKNFEDLVERYNQKHSLNWYLAYSPERTDPGPKAHLLSTRGKHRRTSEIPRIVAGLNNPSREIASALYKKVFKKIEPVESLETGEMIKLVENTFRFVSIGFANEMASIARVYGLNIWEVIRGAKTKGFGLDLCYPGLIGGHCIPIDPHYLGSAARKEGLVAIFIDAAETIHQETKREARDLIHRLLIQQNKGVKGSRILFFGVAYKRNVSDFRESPSLNLMKELFAYGAQLYYWDPLVARHTAENPLLLEFSKEEHDALPAKLSRSLGQMEGHAAKYSCFQINEVRGDWNDMRQAVLSSGRFDCIVLATDHDCFMSAYEDLILTETAPPVADLRNSIESWLSGRKKPSQDKIVLLRKRIYQWKGKKYMLLGVH